MNSRRIAYDDIRQNFARSKVAGRKKEISSVLDSLAIATIEVAWTEGGISALDGSRRNC